MFEMKNEELRMKNGAVSQIYELPNGRTAEVNSAIC